MAQVKQVSIDKCHDSIKSASGAMWEDGSKLSSLTGLHICPEQEGGDLHFAKKPPEEGEPFHFLLIGDRIIKITFCPWCGCSL